ncbi:MAG: ammonium transporter [Eubacteriales bacterium]
MEFSAIDTVWVLLGTVLVFFMQAGFAMVESGFTRAKNAGNIIMKNLMDFSLGSLCYWIIGFGLMYGVSMGGFIGTMDAFILNPADYDSNVPGYVTLMFQTVFCATSATIVSGAMAERTKFSSYCMYSVVLSALVYPISGHWIWGGGWLSEMGFHDFAGSTAVHMVGGVAALIGAKMLGARIGKYDEDGTPKAILGHNLTIGALGVFILWFCWFGFNGGSSLGIEGQEELVGLVYVTTNLATCAAAATTMAITWVKYGKPDVSMSLNGALGGLVAITAGCDAMDPFGAVITGMIAAFIIVFGIEFVDRVLKIDDPVGAVGVHGMCGAFGTIAVGIFSTSEGLVYGNGASLLMVQVIGVLAVAAWVTVTMGVVFSVIKATVGLRVSAHEEINGLDVEEHGLITSYADFMPVTEGPTSAPVTAAATETVAVSTTIPAGESSGITKVTIITRQSKFESLKTAMETIGITGMTATQVMGCGTQKGSTEYYRGVQVAINLLPKIQVEIVVANVPVELVVETAKKVLHTGSYGDGKIFVYPVADVVKVRTGEQGTVALLDTPAES